MTKLKGSNPRRILMLTVLSAILIVIFIACAYILLNQATVKMVSNYTDELAIHDMNTIRMFVTDRWDSMDSIYQKFRKKAFINLDHVISELNNKIASYMDNLYLLDDQGNLYSNQHIILPKEDNPLLTYFEQDPEKFVERYNELGLSLVEEGREYLLYGIHFTDGPITVTDGDNSIRFVALAVINDISKIRGRLWITCFDSQGYASIIDANGDYIVPDEYDASLYQNPNFFNMLASRKIEGMTADEIRRKIANNENFDFWCTTSDGVRRFVSVYIIENSNWNFVIALNESVFSDQVSSFVQLLVSILAILVLIIAVIFLAIARMQKDLRKMYSSVAAGVFNRQYYEDKLSNTYMNALAIMDLDKLKTINDTFGHPAGDQAIEKVANTIAKHVNRKGVVCRFGGDEFVVGFTENLSTQEFNIILESVRNTVASSSFPDYPKLRISMSVGGYYGVGLAKDLLQPADQLLYEAKRSRNQVVTNTD